MKDLKAKAKEVKPKPAQKRFLIVGETGSGKTTFINVLSNFFKNNREYDQAKIELLIPTVTFFKCSTKAAHTERKGAKKSESQTDGVTTYTFYFRGVEFVVMDTPGFADTRGLKKNEENVNAIIQEASNADYLNGIILVVNGTAARFTQNVISVITSIRSFFPNQMARNIILVMTNTNSPGVNFDKSGLGDLGIVIPEGNCFEMNNNAFGKDPRDYSKKDFRKVEEAWEESMETLDSLIDCAARLPPIRSKVFGDILEMRKDFQIKIIAIQDKMKSKLQASTQLKALQAVKPDIANSIEQYKDFKEFTMVKETKQLPTSYHNTVCLKCKITCHEGCGLNEISHDGHSQFLGCCAFSGKDVCKCGHHHGSHAHRKFVFFDQDVSVESVVPSKKALYDTYVLQQQENCSKEETLGADLASLQGSIAEDQAEIKEAAKSLKKLCSGFNLAKDLEVNIGNLEMDKDQLYDPEARAEIQKVIDSLKELCKNFTSMEAEER